MSATSGGLTDHLDGQPSRQGDKKQESWSKISVERSATSKTSIGSLFQDFLKSESKVSQLYV